MKRLSLLSFVGLLAGVLAGCPIYGNDSTSSSGCRNDNCSTTGSSSSGNPNGCSSPSDCGQNQTCGSEGQCHSGDCSLWGCVKGYTCTQNPDQTAQALRFILWSFLNGDTLVQENNFVRLPDRVQASAFKIITSIRDNQGKPLGMSLISSFNRSSQ